MKNKILGPVFSIITPFRKDQKIDYKNLYKYLDFYYSRGCKIFYLMAYNSRLNVLSQKEVEDLNIRLVRYLKKKYKDIIFIGAEKVEGSTDDTIKMCKKLTRNGVDIVSVIFGEKYYYDGQVYFHFSRISKKTKSKLLLHLQPMTNGLSHTPPVINYNLKLIENISLLKSFIAIKEDVKSHNFTIKVLKKIKKNCAIIRSGGGMEGFFKYHVFGCQSWLAGIECIDPKIAFDFYYALINKDFKFCRFIINKIERPFFKLVSKYGWHLTIKSCLSYVNLMSSDERSPMKKLPKKKEKVIFNFMTKIKKISKNKLNKDYFPKVI